MEARLDAEFASKSVLLFSTPTTSGSIKGGEFEWLSDC
jgi:hypothetical protein